VEEWRRVQRTTFLKEGNCLVKSEESSNPLLQPRLYFIAYRLQPPIRIYPVPKDTPRPRSTALPILPDKASVSLICLMKTPRL
jgi:hypothetical protein